ncbi:LysR family transcriptional regulator [Streptomyces sp. WAC05374]|uniref:LysR family transcriptional regulator n=1 Tax=Streptomyces sp. WAC05374 TaxID=2487420 RepID=UPI000F89417A|nr:LysR family transcriptional regulator [Streptomyces sp. WAC05374]RST14385.1 LysR family transcriptional regulator [Streptomyces sp. WAC05374]TDF44702.1 LysR family transcriptional regulator [Streptomyces sp. WAC05374]TDF55942.1 LysR family transcriptional regulator [Streptomyces sp. WAC05374]TDF59885.1 LysR family transcriptional regulator [Streptomyces sp. WAC05374]
MTDRAPDTASGPLDLTLLRTFLAVHRSGSFTAAARLVGLSQPTVTAQVRALERKLGRELFARLPRGVVPTAVADDLAARVAGPLDALEAVTGGPPGEGGAGPVRLAGPAELLCLRVLPALAAPTAARGVVLRVATGLTDDLLEGLRAGHHDLVIATYRPRGRALVATPLMDEEFVLVAAPGWADRIGPGRVAAEGAAALRGVPLVAYAEDLPITRRYWRHVFGTRLTARASVTVPDLRGVLAAVAAGGGVAVLPRYLCAGELADGTLVALLAPEDPPINTAYLVRRPGAVDHPHLALVRDLLVREARGW